VLNTRKRNRYFGSGTGIETCKPFLKEAAACRIDIFPYLDPVS